MPLIDIIIVIVFAASLILGFRKGIIRQMGALAAFFAGIFACRLFGDAATGLVMKLMGTEQEATATASFTASVLGNVLIYLVVFVGVRIASRALRTLSRAMLMGPLDSVLGAIFSLLEWMTGLSIVLNLWVALFPSSKLAETSTIGGGIALQSVMELAPWLLGMLSSATGIEMPV